MTGPETIFGLKVATLISSGVAAVISVALDWRSHDIFTAVGSIIAGVFVATVATELTLSSSAYPTIPAPGAMRWRRPTGSPGAT